MADALMNPAKPAKPAKTVKEHRDKRHFDPVIGDIICEAMTRGESLSKVLVRVKVSPGLFYKWLSEPTFREDYASARKVQAEIMATEIIQIADDASNDTFVDSDGQVRADHAMVARARLRVDTRKWILSKVLPKVYGDRIALTDADGQNLKVDLSWLTARGIGQGSNDNPMTIDADEHGNSSIESIGYRDIVSDDKSAGPKSSPAQDHSK